MTNNQRNHLIENKKKLTPETPFTIVRATSQLTYAHSFRRKWPMLLRQHVHVSSQGHQRMLRWQRDYCPLLRWCINSKVFHPLPWLQSIMHLQMQRRTDDGDRRTLPPSGTTAAIKDTLLVTVENAEMRSTSLYVTITGERPIVLTHSIVNVRRVPALIIPDKADK